MGLIGVDQAADIGLDQESSNESSNVLRLMIQQANTNKPLEEAGEQSKRIRINPERIKHGGHYEYEDYPGILPEA